MTEPDSSCAPKSCARVAPIARAMPISRSSSSTAVVMPVATIAAHERKAIMVAMSVESWLAATCLSRPVRTRSAGSTIIGSFTRCACAALQASTSVPSASATEIPVSCPLRLDTSASVARSISMSGRCSAPSSGRL